MIDIYIYLHIESLSPSSCLHILFFLIFILDSFSCIVVHSSLSPFCFLSSLYLHLIQKLYHIKDQYSALNFGSSFIDTVGISSLTLWGVLGNVF